MEMAIEAREVDKTCLKRSSYTRSDHLESAGLWGGFAD